MVLQERARSRSALPRPKRYQQERSQYQPTPLKKLRSATGFAQLHMGTMKKPAMRSTWFAFRFIRCEELYEEYGRDVFMYYKGNEDAMDLPEGSSVSFALSERDDGMPQAVEVRLIGPPSAGKDDG